MWLCNWYGSSNSQIFLFWAEVGIRDLGRSRRLGDEYKRLDGEVIIVQQIIFLMYSQLQGITLVQVYFIRMVP